MLNYEAEKTTYMVTVTATDSEGLSDTIDVTINVTGVNEAPAFPSSTATREVEENTAADMAIGEAFPEATDPDAEDSLTYSLRDSLTYSLGGDDADSFEAGTTRIPSTSMPRHGRSRPRRPWTTRTRAATRSWSSPRTARV
jgi:PKD repeat protein